MSMTAQVIRPQVPYSPPGMMSIAGAGTSPPPFAIPAATYTPDTAAAMPVEKVSAPTSDTTPYSTDSIVLGPDGNIYAQTRHFEGPANGGTGASSYTYRYALLGSASNLPAVSQASGIPLGALQAQVAQQQVSLNNLMQQGKINPYTPGMTEQELSQSLDSIRNAQQYETSQYLNGASGVGPLTYNQLSALNSGQNQVIDYGQNQWQQGQSPVSGMTNQQLQNASTGYGAEKGYNEGLNYNTASPVAGVSYGALGQYNANQGAVQSFLSNVNANTTNPYSGLSNFGTQQQAGNTGNALSLIRDTYALTPGAGTNGQSRVGFEQGIKDIQDPYDYKQAQYNLANQDAQNQLTTLNRQYDTAAQQFNLGSADYTNGQSRQQYQQGTTDVLNPYERQDALWKSANQAPQQATDTYNLARQGLQDQTQSQSRTMSGLGWAGLTAPRVAGWQ